MFQTGDLVFYGSEGVCRVEELGHPGISGLDKDKEYYTLVPVYRGYKVYVPTDTKVFLRPAMTARQAMELISKIPAIQPAAVQGGTWRFQGEHYQQFMQSHDTDDLVRVIKTVYEKEQGIRQGGRKLSQMDERYRKRAQELLYGELALALGIPMEEVDGFITQALEEK